jgi:AcrR family transcriptional regulator
MPKIVDYAERKQQIAEATWRVILHRGMKGATVRNIAQEAGMSLGALRHSFSTQEELLHYAMKLVKERVTQRIQEIVLRELPPKEKVVQLFLQLLPVDEQKMAEMEVWFAFAFHQKYEDGSLNALQFGFFTEMRGFITFLAQQGLLREELDQEMEAERFYAFIDGLALHAMLEAQRVNPERIVRVLKYHIESICLAD